MKIRLIISIITVIFLSQVFFSISATHAQTKTPTASAGLLPPSSTPADKELIDKLKQIEILKEKIATKVAQVRDEQKSGMMGIIKSIENNTIVIQNFLGEQKFSFSEDTVVFKMENNLKKEAKTSDLKNGQLISSLGNYNDARDLLLSKFIYIQEYPTRITGKIADLDKSNFTLTVKAKDGDQLIDIEKNTAISIYQKGKGSQKGGFSKFKLGDTVFIIASTNAKEENRFNALRIIDLPSLNTSPTSTASPTPSPTKIAP